jgi:hypothetical protein
MRDALRSVRPVPAIPTEQQRTPEQEWADSVDAVSFEMAQGPTWRRRAELMEQAKLAMHRYFGKRAGGRQ